MPRDAYMVVGNHIIESCYAWKSRKNEIELAYPPLLKLLEMKGYKIIRAPPPPLPDTLYDAPLVGDWAINNTRAAFDAADSMRFGETLIAQLLHVTNQAGIDYVRQNLPAGYSVVLPTINSHRALHIDASFMPLKQGVAIYKSSEIIEDLRQQESFKDWKLQALPFMPKDREYPTLYMTTPYIYMNVLSPVKCLC